MKLKYILSWIPGVPIAILNGSFREYILDDHFSDLVAHQISVITFIFLFGIYVWLILRWLKLQSTKESINLGIIWVLFTILFEFVFGHYIMGHSWQILFHDYNLSEGRLWIIVLVWILIAPFTLFEIRKKLKG